MVENCLAPLWEKLRWRWRGHWVTGLLTQKTVGRGHWVTGSISEKAVGRLLGHWITGSISVKAVGYSVTGLLGSLGYWVTRLLGPVTRLLGLVTRLLGHWVTRLLGLVTRLLGPVTRLLGGYSVTGYPYLGAALAAQENHCFWYPVTRFYLRAKRAKKNLLFYHQYLCFTRLLTHLVTGLLGHSLIWHWVTGLLTHFLVKCR